MPFLNNSPSSTMNQVVNTLVLLSDGYEELDKKITIGVLQSSSSIKIVPASANNPRFWIEGNYLSLIVIKTPSRSTGGLDPDPTLAM